MSNSKKMKVSQLVSSAIQVKVLSDTKNIESTPIMEPSQETLFPVDIVEMKQSGSNTAQEPIFALGIDGREYAAKNQNSPNFFQQELESRHNLSLISSMTPVSEMMGYELAAYCSMPIPAYQILIDPNTQDLYFGSRLEPHEGTSSVQILFSKILSSPGSIDDSHLHILCTQLWVTFAMDCFLLNIDRHIGNFLYQKGGQFGKPALIPFDFGLSGFSIKGWPIDNMHLNQYPLCNTIINWGLIINALRQSVAYCIYEDSYKARARDVMDRLAHMPHSNIEGIVNKIPDQWMTRSDKDAFLAWWKSPDRFLRIERIKNEYLS